MGRLFEVTAGGQLVWEYIVPFYNISPRKTGTAASPSNATYRCHRYGPDYPGLQGKRFALEELDTWNLLYGPGPSRQKATPCSKEMENIHSAGHPATGQKQKHVAWGEPKPSVGKGDLQAVVGKRLKMLGY